MDGLWESDGGARHAPEVLEHAHDQLQVVAFELRDGSLRLRAVVPGPAYSVLHEGDLHLWQQAFGAGGSVALWLVMATPRLALGIQHGLVVGGPELVPDFLSAREAGQGGDEAEHLVADLEKLAGVVLVWGEDLDSDLFDAV